MGGRWAWGGARSSSSSSGPCALLSLSLSFLNGKARLVRPTLQGYREEEINHASVAAWTNGSDCDGVRVKGRAVCSYRCFYKCSVVLGTAGHSEAIRDTGG